MSDIYGTEPHNHEAGHESGHDEILQHDHDGVHEAPSDYEFADDHGAGVEENGDMEGAGDEHDMSALPGEAMQAVRRSPYLPIAAAVGGIMILGGLAWWQFGGSSPTPVPPAMNQTASMEPIPVNSAAAAKAVTKSSSPPVSTAAPRTDAAASVDESSVPAMEKGPSAAAMPPKAAPAEMPEPLIVTPSPEDQRITALNIRIDQLQRSLELATQQLGQVANMVVATAPPAGAPTSRDLQDRIDGLEQQIAQLKHPAPVLAAPAALPAANPVPIDQPVATAAPKAEIHRPAPRMVAHKAAKKHETVKSVKVEPVSSGWVLRAASPGQAWVASDGTSRDLKNLHVGDELPGIGRVTAIQQVNGSWIVQGTKGSVQ